MDQTKYTVDDITHAEKFNIKITITDFTKYNVEKM